jgi:thiamine-phosphate pyrophosphorylase
MTRRNLWRFGNIAAHSTSMHQTGLLRIIDAEVNRAAEGLRVIEDYVRFVLDDAHLTSLIKDLRHELISALASVTTTDRLSARESTADVGPTLATPPGTVRATIDDVVAASFKRLQQALRSLEEYAKLADARAAASIEPLRYRAYTLERAVCITAESLHQLADARLYLLLDGGANESAFASLVMAVVQSGVHIIQLRDKKLDDRTLLRRARALRELTRGTKTLFVMNDRADLAVLADADGVHVGQEELTVKDARTVIGPRKLIGVSTHSIEQARQAVLDGANYIGCGPTFPSPTKTFDAFAGLAFLRTVAPEIKLPAFAIGGITRDNLPQVQAAGFPSVAVSGAIVSAADPAKAAREFILALK